VYKNRYENEERPYGKFKIFNWASLHSQEEVVLNRLFPSHMCITAGAYNKQCNMFFLVGYRNDSGGIHVLVLDADSAVNARMSLFVVHAHVFPLCGRIRTTNDDRMVWIVDPVPQMYSETGNILLDIIIESCTEQPVAASSRAQVNRNYCAKQYQLVFPKREEIFASHDLAVPTGLLIFDSKLETEETYSTPFFTTVTHWTKQFLDGNLGMVCSLATIGKLFDPDNPEEPEYHSTTGAARPFMPRFPSLCLHSTERAVLSRHYIRHKSRFIREDIGNMTDRISTETQWSNSEGRRTACVEIIPAGAHSTAGRPVITAYRLPEDRSASGRIEKRIKKATQVSVAIRHPEGRPMMGEGAAIEMVFGLTWITDEWILLEKRGNVLETYFIPDSTGNTIAFCNASLQEDSLLYGLSTELLTNVLDQVQMTEKEMTKIL
jgi:hypothetical protein